MPIYEYVCLDCKDRFEVLRPMKDADAPIVCEACESEHTSRLLSVFFASSGGKVVAGGSSGCASCSSGACSTCGVH
jgi:putative FmdB family regulatory protein